MPRYSKVIFTGPVGAGKTTAIRSLSDIPPVHTDASASDTRPRKTSTTVAMDYGLTTLGGERIHLYGTPGQARFVFMYDILTRGGTGLVLLVDNARAEPFKDLKFFLGKFRRLIQSTGLVIGVTRMDVSPYPLLEEYHPRAAEFGFTPPIFEVDARRRDDVSTLVQSLLYTLDPGIDEER
jgi:signal recognition particle receptor subunit beta